MNFSWPQNASETNRISEDNSLFSAAYKKIESLQGFIISGDITNDYNNFLELSGRLVFYKKASNESSLILIDNLKRMKESWQEGRQEDSLKERTGQGEELFYNTLPDEELKTISRIIDFYQTKI